MPNFSTGFYKEIEVIATIAQEDSDIEDMKQAYSALTKLKAVFDIHGENQSKF